MEMHINSICQAFSQSGEGVVLSVKTFISCVYQPSQLESKFMFM